MKQLMLLLVAILLSSCSSISDEDLKSMELNAEQSLFYLYASKGITAYGLKCKVEKMELQDDTTAYGRISYSFDDWSKEPCPKVNVQAMCEMVKHHGITWQLHTHSLDVFSSTSQVGTELNVNDTTYILNSYEQ